jgi:hypothetical protein
MTWRSMLDSNQRTRLSPVAFLAGRCLQPTQPILRYTSLTLVRLARIELAWITPQDFKSCVSTYFTTVAILVPQRRLELLHLAVPASKTGVSTNSTIGAYF